MQTWFADRRPFGVIKFMPTKVIMQLHVIRRSVSASVVSPNGENDDISLSEALLTR